MDEPVSPQMTFEAERRVLRADNERHLAVWDRGLALAERSDALEPEFESLRHWLARRTARSRPFRRST